MSRKVLFPLVALGLAGALALVVLEIGALIVVEANVLPAPVPRYTLERATSLGPEKSFWADLDPHFGVWHPPNATFRHVKSCFDLEYRSNAHGARDRERDREGRAGRFVVLGDSMTEGYGVSRGERFTNRLEALLQRPFLNFATSGDFGPTQYHLMYRHLARTFDHDAVMIGLLPANDFRDDDIDFGRRIYGDRYRPYWEPTGDGYRLVYERASLEQKSALAHREAGPRNLLRAYSYAFNLYEHVGRARERSEGQSFGSAYYDFSEAELDRMLHSLRLIADDADGRAVVIVMIPIVADVERYRAEGGARPPLTTALEAFAAGTSVRVVDLLPDFDAADPDASRFRHSCDGHWHGGGHAVAADAIARELVQAGLAEFPREGS